MSQTLVLDTDVPRVVDTTSSQILDQERKVSKQRQKQPKASMPAASSSILAAILSTLLLRIAGRTSFVLLGFYLGEHFTSAHPAIPVAEVIAQPEDVHDLDGLRVVGTILSRQDS